MNRKEDNKSTTLDQSGQAGNAGQSQPIGNSEISMDEHSYLDTLDKEEGRMNNGEIGSGIRMEEDNKDDEK